MLAVVAIGCSDDDDVRRVLATTEASPESLATEDGSIDLSSSIPPPTTAGSDVFGGSGAAEVDQLGEPTQPIRLATLDEVLEASNTWLNMTGLGTPPVQHWEEVFAGDFTNWPDVRLWSKRLWQACEAPIWEAEPARTLVSSFFIEDGWDPGSPAMLQSGVQAIWYGAKAYCSSVWPEDATEAPDVGPNMALSFESIRTELIEQGSPVAGLESYSDPSLLAGYPFSNESEYPEIQALSDSSDLIFVGHITGYVQDVKRFKFGVDTQSATPDQELELERIIEGFGDPAPYEIWEGVEFTVSEVLHGELPNDTPRVTVLRPALVVSEDGSRQMRIFDPPMSTVQPGVFARDADERPTYVVFVKSSDLFGTDSYVFNTGGGAARIRSDGTLGQGMSSPFAMTIHGDSLHPHKLTLDDVRSAAENASQD